MRSARALTLTALTLGGCASTAVVAPPRPGDAAAPVAARWHAPLPHDGALNDLERWWQQFDDPQLSRLIDAAQAVSPTVSAAKSRIETARAAHVAAGAALLPAVEAVATASRGRADRSTPAATALGAGVQAAWEVDVFGGRTAAAHGAQARLEATRAAWHDARVSVAAETATTYVALRACEAQLVQVHSDAASRAETARLTDLAANAGFRAPADAALARASAAQANVTLAQQRQACETLVKALVALTGDDESALRAELVTATARLPAPALITVAAVPAQALAQRPDVHAAAREVVATSADTAAADAERWPRLTLAGQIGASRVSAGGFTTSGAVWSLGPLAVTLPLFDAGARRANAEAARARYDAAVAAYAASLRNAVREVETALVALQSTAERVADSRVAAADFERSYRASESRYRGGLASLFELEDARRTAVAAQAALIELQRERVAAWIALYRALGGGWTPSPAPSPAAARARDDAATRTRDAS